MRVVSKAEFAREAGVTASAISKALKTILKETLSEGGINTDHPDAIRYMSRCGFVGRPHGSKNAEIADFVTIRFRELEGLKNQLPRSVLPLVENIDGNIFYIGFASKWMGAKERNDRMAFVESSLERLRAMV